MISQNCKRFQPWFSYSLDFQTHNSLKSPAWVSVINIFFQMRFFVCSVSLFWAPLIESIYEEPRLGLNRLNDGADRRMFPLEDEDHQGTILIGSWFSTFVFRNVPGTVPECVRICGFKRNSSNLARAPKMRDFVLLNSWDNFLVTLPSILSKTSVIYSSVILGTEMFRDWPFLLCSSCVSLGTAANFCLFLNVAIFSRENGTQLWRLKYFLFVKHFKVVTKNVNPLK